MTHPASILHDPTASKARTPWWRNGWCVGLLLAFVTLALRAATLGNPLLDDDDGFYLYGGGQLLAGHKLYLDFWDRKPFGLFALFAFFHAFGPWRFWAYQLGACACVWGTAMAIWRMACFLAPNGGAVAAALLYIAGLNMRGGFGGETPVFYNFLTACAFLLVVNLLTLANTDRVLPEEQPLSRKLPPCLTDKLLLTEIGAMALFGLGLQIKPTVVFEGVYCALALLWFSYRFSTSKKPGAVSAGAMLLGQAGLMILIALLPTLLVVIYYAHLHAVAAWWQANVLSSLHRGAEFQWHKFLNLLFTLAVLTLVWPLSRFLALRFTPFQRTVWRFISGWAVVAVIAVLLFTQYYKYYALPLFVPFAVLWAPLWERPLGRALVLLLLVVLTIGGELQVHRRVTDRTAADWQAMLRAVSAPPGCVFEYKAQGILLDATPTLASCHLTPWSFPDHLGDAQEVNSIGIDPFTELKRVMAGRPRYVATTSGIMEADRRGDPEANPPLDRYLAQILQRDYVPVYHHREHRRHGRDREEDMVIWQRREPSSPVP
ncbi:hypothetical protein [Oecophyllibacter saccharovorans]|uniref:Glycosyltransferase RgtA/B/C/D-like domain-containing protein n=1 Tax=Oecophyllibacter saccharovorans TaxID=2558360 RepID=A0A506UKV4_9PROT|nr:hypothetical protein [Oecophyllibacter saccharovorans]TPW33966.1 hypothetical protein E3202_05185 [Oecophyllibacter saccharovorans]